METNNEIVDASEPHFIQTIPIAELTRITNYASSVKKSLMTEGTDYVVDWKGRQYTARSGFAKLGQGFDLSDDEPEIRTLWNKDIIGEDTKDYKFTHQVNRRNFEREFKTRIFGFEAKVKITNLGTGRYVWGEGACSVDELDWTNNLGPKWYHRCIGTAKTRAWNRGISNFVGSADVSAEEVGLTYSDETDTTRKVESEAIIHQNDDSGVAFVFYPESLGTPNTVLKEEIQKLVDIESIPEQAVSNWLKELGFQERLDFDVNSDPMKVTVDVKDGTDWETSEDEQAFDKLLLSAKFRKSKTGWRYNLPKPTKKTTPVPIKA